MGEHEKENGRLLLMTIRSPSVTARKLVLTSHISVSVGWLGAVAGFMALSIAGLLSQDILLVRTSYLAMNLIAWYVIVPLALASLLTGIIQSLISPWGLVKHYWVLTKLGLTIFSTVILLLKMKIISTLASSAAGSSMAVADFYQGRKELVVHSAGGLFVLLFITGISVFKPWGRTSFGKK